MSPGRRDGPDEKWELVEPLGEGGAGTVWRARFVGAGDFGRTVAVKMLTHVPGEADALPLLQREARNLARVKHRAVVHADRLVRIDGTWALVMELVAGVSLDRVVERGAVPVRAALEVVEELACALHAAVTAPGPDGQPLQLVHCDLKPSNIQLTPHGEPRLLDFGVARLRGERSGSVSGTPAYMAPERWRGEVMPASDVYALGCVLFELWTGQPFGRCSVRPGAHTERVQSAATYLQSQDLPPDAIHLWAAMMATAPTTRPTAGQVAERADDLIRALPGLRLRSWAPSVVGSLPAATQPHPVPLPSPRTVHFTESWWTDTAPEPLPPSTATAHAAVRASPWTRVAGTVGVVVVGVVMWWRSVPEPKPAEPEPVAPPEAMVVPESLPEPAPTQPKQPSTRHSAPSTPSPPREAPPPEAPPPEPPPPEPAPARVQVSRADTTAHALVGSGGRYPLPGSVPAGTYTVHAQFSGLGTMPAGTVTIGSEPLVIRCDEALALCWTEPESP